MISVHPTARKIISFFTFAETTVFVLIFLLGTMVANAQDASPTASPTPTPTAAEQSLMDENRLLDLKQKNVALKKQIREDQPQPTATPLEGKTTIDENVAIETQLVTFKAMSSVVLRIAGEIRANHSDAQAILIYNADDVAALRHYRTSYPLFTAKIGALQKQYDDLIAAYRAEHSEMHALNPLLGLDLGTTAIRSFVDFLAMFRSDTEIKGKSVTVEESALVAETFRALRNEFNKGIELYYPRVVPVQKYEALCKSKQNTDVYCSPMLRLLEHLYRRRDAANSQLVNLPRVLLDLDKATRDKNEAEAKIKELDAKIGDLKEQLKNAKTKAQKRKLESQLTEAQQKRTDQELARDGATSRLDDATREKSFLDQFKELNQQFDNFLGSITQQDDKTGSSELALLANGENLNKLFSTRKSYWLQLQSMVAGGNNRIRKNFIRFFTGARVDHSGGLEVAWELFNSTGISADSNAAHKYEGYKAPKEIQSDDFKDDVKDPDLSAKRADQTEIRDEKEEIDDSEPTAEIKVSAPASVLIPVGQPLEKPPKKPTAGAQTPLKPKQ